MGSSTWSDIVLNVAMIGDVKELYDLYEADNLSSFLHGWQVESFSSGDDCVGRKKSLYADKLIKDDKVVFLVNTSEYANGGAYWFAVFADERAAVEGCMSQQSIHNGD